MKKVIVTGGAGFIGSHVSRFYLKAGFKVRILDNLSRAGARANLTLLQNDFPEELRTGRLSFVQADIRISSEVDLAISAFVPDLVVHEAAQVAVTTSVTNPRLDFDVNALGTFNLLEAVRKLAPESFFVFASTNKVYGGMEDVVVVEEETRFRYRDYPEGLDESRTLDFHSPYACSKGVADQYVHDYSRVYGLRTAVFRQSCIYGTHQFGVEDQGWIAWFTIARILEKPVTIYGSGKQVRDILWVDDLVRAYNRAWETNAGGAIFNMGGGAENSLSLLELVSELDKHQKPVHEIAYDEERPGDQPVYIANAGKARAQLDWRPETAPADGIEKLYRWIYDHKDLVAKVLA